MPMAARVALFCALGFVLTGQTGCNMVPRQQLAQAQNRTRQLYEQNKALALDRENQIRAAQAAQAESQRLQQQLADKDASYSTLQRRVDNLLSERGKMQSSFTSMNNAKSPLADSTTREFEELARKYPNFKFDPQTGVSKFDADVLFESGSDAVRPDAEPLLREFANVLAKGDAQALNILVVGHTDDRPVSKPGTKAKHPDNWYLSGHRAVSVTHSLRKFGIQDKRMGFAGYGPYQPLAPGKDEASRKKNRRVEIFVLAPNASMAGREAGTMRN